MGLLANFEISGSAISAQSMRLNTTASNMANAETVASSEREAYRARQTVFQTHLLDQLLTADVRFQRLVVGVEIGVEIVGEAEAPADPFVDLGIGVSGQPNRVSCLPVMSTASRRWSICYPRHVPIRITWKC